MECWNVDILARYFYYMSGVNEPDCYMTYDIERNHSILYIPPITVERVGHPLVLDKIGVQYQETATNLSGIKGYLAR